MKKLLRALCLALLAMVLAPSIAFGGTYSVDAVEINAAVSQDGTLSVIQRRTYDINGSINGIYWDVPRGTYRGREVAATINSVGVITQDGLVVFEEGYDGVAGTYEVSDGGDYWGLKIYWPTTDETVTFQVSYDATNLITRWADVGELYWQYVVTDPSSQVEWKNVTMTVKLPIPDGEAVTPGENVRAWGHGPIDGKVSFGGDSVKFFSPGVGTAEFLEARVTFPEAWVPGVLSEGVPHLDTVLDEEGQWAKEANAKRRNARLIVYGIPGSMVLMGFGSILLVRWYQKHLKKKMPKPQFTEKYFRDVPTNDHPAVLGMLYRDGATDHKDFSASLMHLTDEGRITLDTVWLDKMTRRGGTKRVHEWRMLLHKDAAEKSTSGRLRAGGKAIDDAAFNFLYDVIADKHKHVFDASLYGTNGEPYVVKDFFDEVADSWPQAYATGYGKWTDAVRTAYDERKFEKDLDGSDIFTGLIGLGNFAVSIVLSVVGMVLGVPALWACIALIVQFGCGIAIVFLDDDTPSSVFSQEAVDIKAQLEALKRWLVDFTRLEEAIPTDVVLWNRLLVMATVLGVADKVVKQLKVYAPQLVDNPAFSSIDWYAYDMDESLDPPLNVFTRSIALGNASSSNQLYHEVSTYDTATSSDSSSSGSGGGFSSGGGGGYSGGGGRGGVF